MSLKFTIERTQGEQGAPMLRVSPVGSLDTTTAPQLRAELLPAVEAHHARYVVFNLAQLVFLSTAGLQVFVSVQRALRERGGKILMLNMQPQIAKVFEIVQAMSSNSVFASAEEMDRYLRSMQTAQVAKP
jgi:anti-anti-sigma factor